MTRRLRASRAEVFAPPLFEEASVRSTYAIPEKARRLLPLLASPIDGEALGACRALSRTLAASGLDMNDLAAALVQGGNPLQTDAGKARPSTFDMARVVRDIGCGRLTIVELRFLEGMLRLGRNTPTVRQAKWLADIYDRLTGRAAA